MLGRGSGPRKSRGEQGETGAGRSRPCPPEVQTDVGVTSVEVSTSTGYIFEAEDKKSNRESDRIESKNKNGAIIYPEKEKASL